MKSLGKQKCLTRRPKGCPNYIMLYISRFNYYYGSDYQKRLHPEFWNCICYHHTLMRMIRNKHCPIVLGAYSKTHRNHDVKILPLQDFFMDI